MKEEEQGGGRVGWRASHALLWAAGRRPSKEHKGWYVPRALPHFDLAEVVQAITFRLADALPRDVVIARRDEASAAHRRLIAAALDACHGGCLLRDPAHAEIVETALLHGAGFE